jgi:hypothetical protein
LSDTPQPFDGARLKVKRAYEHIRHFNDAFKAFVQQEPYALRPEAHHGYTAWFFLLEKRVPDELMLIVGDAIHNLRSALDHCAWELVVEIDKWSPTDDQKRAISLTPKSRRKKYITLVDRIETPREDTKQFLKNLAPFVTGADNPIVRLSHLDIRDKHHLIVPVVSQATISGLQERVRANLGWNRPDDIVTELGEITIDLANPDESTMVGRAYQFTCFASATIKVYGPPGHPDAPLLEFGDHYNVAFSVIFAEMQPFPREPILPTLERLAELVIAIIQRFEDFVRERAMRN